MAGETLGLKKGVVDVFARVVVVADTVGGRVELADAERNAIVNARQDEIVGSRRVIANEAVADESDLIASEQPRELVEAGAAESGVEERETVVSETRLNGTDVERLQELRLEELAVSGDRVTRQAQIGVGEQAMSRKISGIGGQRFPPLDQRQLFEAEVSIDSVPRLALRAARSESSRNRDR